MEDATLLAKMLKSKFEIETYPKPYDEVLHGSDKLIYLHILPCSR